MNLPEWHNVGIEPPQEFKDNGWTPGVKPPAQYMNWWMNSSYLAIKALQEGKANNTDLTSLRTTLTTHLDKSKQYTTLWLSNQAIPNATIAKLTFDNIKHFHGADFVTNSSGDLIVEKGLYLAFLTVTFANNSTGFRRIALPGAVQQTNSTGETQLTVSTLFEVSQDITYTFQVYQDSGNVLAVTVAEAKIYRVGDLI